MVVSAKAPRKRTATAVNHAGNPLFDHRVEWWDDALHGWSRSCSAWCGLLCLLLRWRWRSRWLMRWVGCILLYLVSWVGSDGLVWFGLRWRKKGGLDTYSGGRWRSYGDRDWRSCASRAVDRLSVRLLQFSSFTGLVYIPYQTCKWPGPRRRWFPWWLLEGIFDPVGACFCPAKRIMSLEASLGESVDKSELDIDLFVFIHTVWS